MADIRPTEIQSDKVLHKKHPLAIRWFHWINFPVLFIMIWSGLMIYSAYTPPLDAKRYVTVLGSDRIYISNDNPGAPPLTARQDGRGLPILLFPDSFYRPLAPKWLPHFLSSADPDNPSKRYIWSLDYRLAEGMGWHFLFAWFFALNGLAYVLFLAVSGQWRKIVPKPKAVVEAIKVVLIDLHLSKAKMPVRKYNAAQQIAYTGVVLMGLLMLLTGIAIYKPAEQSWLTRLFFGYTAARFIHFWTTIAFLGFFLVHVGQVIRTGWNNFRGMVTGYELVTPEEKSLLEAEA
ncbi:MAG TPA: cytochrome b/b6 domain-containing protein [Fimbriimonas sp.]|nr:cytochrome b/b6 domain-containing protein [Fimbriimonas sp.]